MEFENLENELTEKFIELHKSQLVSAGVPEIYWKTLFNKLRDEIFDAGNYFQICQRVDEEDEILGYKAICINNLNSSDPKGLLVIFKIFTFYYSLLKINFFKFQFQSIYNAIYFVLV